MMLFLGGTAIVTMPKNIFPNQHSLRYGHLATPLAMGVVFSMLASCLISRTLTPITISLLLRKIYERHGASPGWPDRFHAALNEQFDRFRNFYGWLLADILRRRILTPAVAVSVVIGAGTLAVFVGTDFFSSVDAGLI